MSERGVEPSQPTHNVGLGLEPLSVAPGYGFRLLFKVPPPGPSPGPARIHTLRVGGTPLRGGGLSRVTPKIGLKKEPERFPRRQWGLSPAPPREGRGKAMHLHSDALGRALLNDQKTEGLLAGKYLREKAVVTRRSIGESRGKGGWLAPPGLKTPPPLPGAKHLRRHPTQTSKRKCT